MRLRPTRIPGERVQLFQQCGSAKQHDVRHETPVARWGKEASHWFFLAYRGPWGLYLRLPHFRLFVGPRFGSVVAIHIHWLP